MSEPRSVQILLAEDNAADIYLVREALNLQGFSYELHSAEDGERALEYLANVEEGKLPCPDLLLLDLNLPRVAGTEVLERARATQTCSKAPVIVLTSSDAPKDRAEVERLGANSYFRKPSNLDEFLRLGELVSSVLKLGMKSSSQS